MDKVNIYSDTGQLICVAKSAQIDARQIEGIEHDDWREPNSMELDITLDGISSRTGEYVMSQDEQQRLVAIMRSGNSYDGTSSVLSPDDIARVLNKVREAVMGANMLSDVEKEYVMFRIDEAMKEI